MKINEKNLYVFATSPPYDCEGFLSKRGEVNKAFLRRYFVLKGNLLFYFERKGDKEPLGLIIVEGCTIELSEESDQYCFEIAFNGNRTYVLCADSQESMERWMKVLTCAGYEYKKLMVAELQRKLHEIEDTREKILAENQTNLTTVPRPPPRRTNPFNRPAPPLPTLNSAVDTAGTSNNNNNTSAYMPFINGASQRLQAGNANNSPIPLPRQAKSEFYIHNQKPKQQQQPQQMDEIRSIGVITKETNFSYANGGAAFENDMETSSTAIANFERNHEIFRALVMKDVLEYRAQQDLQTKPLIDL